MTIYQRDIRGKLTALRMLFIAFVAILIYDLIIGMEFWGYLVIILQPLFAFIVVDGLEVADNHFSIRKYYVYGLIPKKWVFSLKENLIMRSNAKAFGQDDDKTFGDYDSGEIGWLSFLLVFIHGGKIRRRLFAISSAKNSSEPVYIYLNEEEYKLVKPSPTNTDLNEQSICNSRDRANDLPNEMCTTPSIRQRQYH